MSLNKKILILAYKFPPYEGVGARRWAKFAKYFAKEGYKVHVITANWGKNTNKSWSADVNHENIIIKQLNSFFDRKYMPNLTGKLFFKAERILAKIFCWTDEAYSSYVWNKSTIIKYIKSEQIKLVVASGGPFSANYFGAIIKKKIPSIKLVQDFRDPWITDYFFDHPNMSPNDRVYKKEVKMEAFSIANADAIFSVTPGCMERLDQNINSYGLKDVNHILMENGFDEDDRVSFPDDCFPSGFYDKTCVNISHFGTVQFGREKSFYQFLIQNEEKLKAEKTHFCFHFFGSFHSETKKMIENSELKEMVKFHSFIPPREVQKFMFFADMHLVLNDEIYYYAYGSKVYDALMHKKPILLLSKEEGLYKLVKDNRLGMVSNNSVLQNEQLSDRLIENKTKLKQGEFINGDYNFEKHSVSSITKRMINAFNFVK